MVKLLIEIMIVLAVAHFVYSGIILPMIRFSLRSDLFKLRDQLRNLKIRHDLEISDEVFNLVQETVNNTIKLLAQVDLTTLAIAARRIKDEQELNRMVVYRIGLIEGCSIPEVMSVYKESGNVFMKAVLANTGMWFLYVVPVAILVVMFKQIGAKLKFLISAPEKDIDEILPTDHLAAF